MDKKEIIQLLQKAESSEEIQQILTNNEYEISDERLQTIPEAAKGDAEEEELSLDELSAVSGGVTACDYATDGCVATVEYDSDCWGTDDGCIAINNESLNLLPAL